MKLQQNLIILICLFLFAQLWLAETPTCPKGYQPYSNRCITQHMADYISCVEASGGNHDEISLEVSNAQGGRTAAGVSGSGSGVVVKGSGSVSLDRATEQALQKKFREKWGSQGMESCLKALGTGKNAPKPAKKAPTETRPADNSNMEKDKSLDAPTTAGNITQGAGSIAQIGGQNNQAIVNNFGPPTLPPVELKWSVQEISPAGSNFKYEKQVTITTNVPLNPVAVGIVCDSAVENTTATSSHGGVWTNLHLFVEGNKAFVYYEGTPLIPTDSLYVSLRSNQPFSVQAVGPAKIKGLND
jgi:hypothetical protein